MKQNSQNELENNVYFWQKLDTLILSSDIIIDRPAGSRSQTYPSMIYPVDAGFLKDTVSMTGNPIYCYRGSLGASKAVGVVVQADILARDCLTKILIGCTPQECSVILKFINACQCQKAILVRRGDETPQWATAES